MQRLLFSVLFFLLVQAVNGQGIFLSNLKNGTSIGRDVFICEDETNMLDINEVIALDDFIKSDQEIPNFKISKSTFWIKIVINNDLVNDEKFVISVDHPIIDTLEYYLMKDEVIKDFLLLGENRPFKTRKYQTPSYIIDIKIDDMGEHIIYLKVRSGDQLLLPLTLGPKDDVLSFSMSNDMIFGVYVGIILIMILYNFFVYTSVDDISYIYYIFYVLMVGLTQATIKGYSYKYLWPNSPYIAIQSMYWIPALVGVAVGLFTQNFLKLKTLFPATRIGYVFFYSAYGISIILSLFNQYFLSQQLIQLTAMFGSFFTLYIAFKVARGGYRPARFFLLGWTIFLGSVITYVLKTFGVIHHNMFTNYILEIGSSIETVILALALADKINIYKRDRIKAIEDKKQVLKEQNVFLESQVKARTHELRDKNEVLNMTLGDLKSAQSQLVQAEKMASLGQLTAGIAHEINNSMNYATQRVQVLKRDFADITEILEKYKEIYSGTDAYKSIEKLMIDLDYEILQEEIPESIEDIEDGVNRAVGIAKGLKDFSRMDEVIFKEDSINDGVASTIKMLKSKLTNIDLKLDLGVIPDIVCNIGKLNQVFMNIVDNAIDALMENNESNLELEVATLLNNESVNIIIKDNGSGMSEEVKANLFDPFYTTKDVGKGTGLGMSISLVIINEHHGEIKVNSKVGEGTEMIISIPIK